MCCQLDYDNFFLAKNENQGLSLTEIFRYLMYRKDDILKASGRKGDTAMISGIGGMGFNPYIYPVNEEPGRVQTASEAAKESEDSIRTESSAVSLTADNEAGQTNNAPVKSNPNDFKYDFKKGNDLNIIQGTSKFKELENTDKALAQMQQDSILDRYKYFVNPSNLGTDEDGTVRIKVK